LHWRDFSNNSSLEQPRSHWRGFFKQQEYGKAELSHWRGFFKQLMSGKAALSHWRGLLKQLKSGKSALSHWRGFFKQLKSGKAALLKWRGFSNNSSLERPRHCTDAAFSNNSSMQKPRSPPDAKYWHIWTMHILCFDNVRTIYIWITHLVIDGGDGLAGYGVSQHCWGQGSTNPPCFSFMTDQLGDKHDEQYCCEKDTASRDISHGSSRAEINTETVMMWSTVVKMFNLEPNMMSSTVVKEDTASHDICHGSGITEIITETIMTRSTVVYKNKVATSSDIVCIKQHDGFLQNYVITRED
jgi:hypothetical protein